MAVVQVAASLTVLAHPLAPVAASAFGLVTAWAAGGLAASARLVEWLPWLALRMPAPAAWVSATYLLALAGLVAGPHLPAVPPHRVEQSGGAVPRSAGVCAIWIVLAPSTWRWPWRIDGLLRVVALDVGQGDATLVEFPDGARWLVDAGGLPGSVAFDIGERVVAPSLWARGTGRLDALVLTHGDPDHIGGAAAVIADFAPSIFDGIPVASARAAAEAAGPRPSTPPPVGATPPRASIWTIGGAELRVWHPPPPDWERPRVRNDDSIVIELRFGEVSIVLPGDIGERGRTLAGRRDSAGPLIGSSRPPTTAARRPRATSGSTRCAPTSSCSAAGVRTATGIPRRRSWIGSANEARRCSGRMTTGRWWWRRMGGTLTVESFTGRTHTTITKARWHDDPTTMARGAKARTDVMAGA